MRQKGKKIGRPLYCDYINDYLLALLLQLYFTRSVLAILVDKCLLHCNHSVKVPPDLQLPNLGNSQQHFTILQTVLTRLHKPTHPNPPNVILTHRTHKLAS